MPPGPLVLDGGGSPSIQVVLDGTRFDDLVGHRFAVVARRRALLDGPAGSWWVDDGAMLLAADDRPELVTMLDALDADVAVVRPDRHLFTVGDVVEIPPPETRHLLGANHE